MYITYKGQEYECATTLRVAYLVQGQHNHKPYTEIFNKVGDMTVEDQIGIVYASVQAANKGLTQHIKLRDFIEEYLDEYTLTDLLDQIKEIIEGIMGKNFDDIPTEAQDAPESENF